MTRYKSCLAIQMPQKVMKIKDSTKVGASISLLRLRICRRLQTVLPFSGYVVAELLSGYEL